MGGVRWNFLPGWESTYLEDTLPETNSKRPWTWMVGRFVSFWVSAYFQLLCFFLKKRWASTKSWKLWDCHSSLIYYLWRCLHSLKLNGASLPLKTGLWPQKEANHLPIIHFQWLQEKRAQLYTFPASFREDIYVQLSSCRKKQMKGFTKNWNRSKFMIPMDKATPSSVGIFPITWSWVFRFSRWGRGHLHLFTRWASYNQWNIYLGVN